MKTVIIILVDQEQHTVTQSTGAHQVAREALRLAWEQLHHHQAPPPEPEQPVCPIHQVSKPSKFGGLYCPAPLDEGGYCRWKIK